MHLSLSRKTSRLPKRFPVGTTYVVEGRGGEDGNLCVFSRYVVLPNGQRINLGADLGGSAASRARRARSRCESAPPNTRKGRAPRLKKISANGGTSRRHGR
ncbi:MAG: hypothetical protein WA837_12910 [Xanthobacteraceae bacterium]